MLYLTARSEKKKYEAVIPPRSSSRHLLYRIPPSPSPREQETVTRFKFFLPGLKHSASPFGRGRLNFEEHRLQTRESTLRGHVVSGNCDEAQSCPHHVMVETSKNMIKNNVPLPAGVPFDLCPVYFGSFCNCSGSDEPYGGYFQLK